MQTPTLVATAAEIREVADALRGHQIIALDTEFIRETTFYPIVEIIQVATENRSWLIDAAAFKKGHRPGPKGGYDPGIQPLLDVFQDPSILKILHAAQGDQECLYTSFGVTAKPSLDTAVAASLCGYGESIGLGKLLKAALDITLEKGHARTNWSVRPLPQQLLDYAAADVDHLVALGQKMIEQLEKLGRKAWAFETSAKWESPSLYEADVEALVGKLARGGRLDKKGYSALIQLVQWREDRVRQLNLPRRWVADDAVLTDLAHVRPKDKEHLAAFRGLSKGELKNSADAILAALQRAGEEPRQAPARGQRPDLPTPEESQALDLLKCFVGILADKHRISIRHLMPSDRLLPLLRAQNASLQEMVSSGILTESAAQLMGEDLIAFLQGRRSLAIQGSQIQIIEIGSSHVGA